MAEITLRDSSDMGIIAAVTLFFLPGTLTATLFSTSFFNFQVNTSSGDPETVTRWVWLYWGVTGALTAVVMVAWWAVAWWRGRKRYGDEEVDKASSK